MDRRTFLSVAGASFAGIAGCIGGDGGTSSTPTATVTGTDTASPTATIGGPRTGDDLPNDETPEDGYPPAFETTPNARSFDIDEFRTTGRDGQSVPLAPVEAAYYWYVRGEARFADARGTGQYEQSHIYGAVSSPASGRDDDPVEDWPKDERIICYCGCPHHLSSIRAADLIADEYEQVAIIDEGFWEWVDRDLPIAGAEVEGRPAVRVIEGRTDERFAGESAWARHRPSDQIEATEIAADGSFSMHLYFSGLSDDTDVTVETPGYEVTAPLSELTESVVTG